MPDDSTEESINESLPLNAVAAEPLQPEYTIIAGSLFCQGNKLTDNLGFSYIVKDKSHGGNVTCWRCSISNKHITCPATVHQEGDVFIAGPHKHLHPTKPGITRTLQTWKKINTIAMSDVFTSAFEITEKVLTENVNQEPTPTLSLSVQLVQNSNCLHQHARPKDLRDPDFDLAQDFIPDGFFHQDITVDDCRHLHFATDKIINILL